MGDRGQTTLDYLFGIGLFILTVGMAFALVPALTGPFLGGSDAGALVADRAADTLTADTLGHPERPGVVNESRVAAFFDQSPAAVHDDLSLDDSITVNVTLTNRHERWAVGPTPPDARDSVYSAWRVIEVNGTRSDLRVVVW
jgi:hypothetical protein